MSKAKLLSAISSLTGILTGNAGTIGTAVSGTDIKTVNGSSIIGSGDVPVVSGFKNKIVNGDFQIWQGGTSFSNPTTNATAYCADQWVFFRSPGFAGNITATQQQTQTNSKGIRVQRTAGDVNTSAIYLTQPIESLEAVKLAGKTVTVQCKIKCGANFSATSNILYVQLISGTGTNEAPTASITGQSNAINTPINLTTTLTQVSLSATINSNCNELYLSFAYNPTSTASTNDWFEVTDVQLEEGSVATAFDRRPYGVELMLCKRYYEELYIIHSNNPSTQYASIAWTVEKRIAPSLTVTIVNGGGNPTVSVDVGTGTKEIYQSTAPAGTGTVKVTGTARL